MFWAIRDRRDACPTAPNRVIAAPATEWIRLSPVKCQEVARGDFPWREECLEAAGSERSQALADEVFG